MKVKVDVEKVLWLNPRLDCVVNDFFIPTGSNPANQPDRPRAGTDSGGIESGGPAVHGGLLPWHSGRYEGCQHRKYEARHGFVKVRQSRPQR